MQSVLANIYSVDAVRAIDRNAIASGIPGYELMTRAAAAAVRIAQERFPDAKHWLIVCGAGNNGGDGYVVARLAGEVGISVSVVSLTDPNNLGGDAATAYADFAAAGGAVSQGISEVTANIDSDIDLVVDAILGSGLGRDLVGDFAAAVGAINQHPAPVLALDIPTGLHGDSGKVMGAAVVADHTTTFVGQTSGLVLDAGPEHAGVVTVHDLDIPENCRANVTATYRRIVSPGLTRLLRPRARAAHKGDFGHVLVVGGGPGMPGAARLCAEAALRVGAGRVSVATHPEHAALITASRPELMSHGVASENALTAVLERADIVAFGPGLGQSDWAREVYSAVQRSSKPAVWDADALNLLAKSPKSVENRVITPHPGEAATLLSSSAAVIQQDRIAAAGALASKYGGVTVLKGAGTLVSYRTETPIICTAGNPGMAAPGMGDVLTGCIAGLIAQGLSVSDGAAIGVEVHAQAGDLAAVDGERGLSATDVIGHLRTVVNP